MTKQSPLEQIESLKKNLISQDAENKRMEKIHQDKLAKAEQKLEKIREIRIGLGFLIQETQEYADLVGTPQWKQIKSKLDEINKKFKSTLNEGKT